MVQAVIFDLDGTLLDTKQDLANSINLTLKSLNRELKSQEEIISHVGNGIKRLVSECVNPKNEIEENEALKLFQEFYSKEYLKTTYPYKGMVELVKELSKLGIVIGVNSNKDDKYTKELIKKHYKEIDLKYVIGSKEGIERKPSPQAVESILYNMGINKEDTLYIGDSG
ncbi:MAG: HAD hydrolase-like protein, partial [Bacteroidales bacterium]|nr:HAD hydrolase-like protein [Bacteroidales bacterium]